MEIGCERSKPLNGNQPSIIPIKTCRSLTTGLAFSDNRHEIRREGAGYALLGVSGLQRLLHGLLGVGVVAGRQPSLFLVAVVVVVVVVDIAATRMLRIAAPAGIPAPERQREGPRLIEAFIAEALVSNAACVLGADRARISSSQAEAAVFLLAVDAVVVFSRSRKKRVSRQKKERGSELLPLLLLWLSWRGARSLKDEVET